MSALLQEQSYPLTPEETVVFGWATPNQPLPVVMWTRTPRGDRIIPTRELLIDGAYTYGFIETSERCVQSLDPEPWEIEFEAKQPVLGLLM